MKIQIKRLCLMREWKKAVEGMLINSKKISKKPIKPVGKPSGMMGMSGCLYLKKNLSSQNVEFIAKTNWRKDENNGWFCLEKK